MKKPKRWCWYCKHRGPRFRVPGVSGNEGHVHCGHPDPEIACGPDGYYPDTGLPTSGWATLRRAFETCAAWEPDAAEGGAE